MMIKNSSIIIAIIFLNVLTDAGYTQTNEKLLKYGLEFGIKKKDAKKILETAGYGKVDHVSDSKDIDSITIEGSVVEGVEPDPESNTQSELEFYEDRLMSTKVGYSADNIVLLKQLENKYLKELIARYGQPLDKEDVMGITSWMWKLGDHKILLNSNSRKNRLGISHLFLPIVAKKHEKEFKVKLKGEEPDVAKETFLR